MAIALTMHSSLYANRENTKLRSWITAGNYIVLQILDGVRSKLLTLRFDVPWTPPQTFAKRVCVCTC